MPSLTKQDFEDSGHFEKYSVEAPLSPFCLVLEEPVVRPYDIGLPQNEFINSVEDDLALIVNSAALHADLGEKLKKLDENYFTNLAGLYANQKTVKKRAIPCGENNSMSMIVEDEITVRVSVNLSHRL